MRPCNYVGSGCHGGTNMMCFACGLPACANKYCSLVMDYYHYGKRRLCTSCSDEYKRYEEMLENRGKRSDCVLRRPRNTRQASVLQVRRNSP